MIAGEGPAAAQDAARESAAPPRKAPDSPRIKVWNRRIFGWGCLPAMVAGLVAALRVPYAVEVGTALALLVGVPVAAYALWLRWRNQRAYREALAAAAATGARVKARVDGRGNHVYEVQERRVEAPVTFDEARGPAGS